MSIEKIIPLDKELVNIFGVNDQNLKYLKDKFKKIKINVKGNVVYISGDNGQTTDIMKILDEMLSMAERGEIIEIEDLKLMSNIESSKKFQNIYKVIQQFILSIALALIIDYGIIQYQSSNMKVTDLLIAIGGLASVYTRIIYYVGMGLVSFLYNLKKKERDDIVNSLNN